jgi:plastocyanin
VGGRGARAPPYGGPALSREVRSRVSLGFILPIAALLGIGVLVFAFSRILLALGETIAPWVALLFALNILVGCALAAALPGRRSFAFLGTLLVATIIGGGIAGAVVGERPVHSLIGEEHETPEPTEEPTAPPTGQPTKEPTEEPTGPPPEGLPTIAAQGLAFDTDELRFPPESEVGLRFLNQDTGIPHNVAIYQSAGGEPIFQGEVITGPAETDYTFTTPAPGEYYFQCDVHPNMNGSVAVG